jgi:hypothetical protein
MEKVMPAKNRIKLIILGLIIQLFVFGRANAQPVEVTDNASGWEIPDTGWRNRSLVPISTVPCIVEGNIVGQFTVYDDPTTERSVDYWELYDNDGDLVAISWFDRFGIERLAIDRGLVDEGDKLEGAFVVFSDGDSV